MIALFLLQGLVFAAWAFMMFRTLFHLRSRGEAKTGQVFSGPFTFLSVTGDWLRDPATRRDRLILLALTLALFALIAAQAALLG